MTKFTEIVQAISHTLHITKPLIFEAMLFVWAVVEMGRFILGVIFGEHAA